MLCELPPAIRVTDSTAFEPGAMRRETSVCAPVTICAAQRIVSAVRCGCAAWPPAALTVISKRSAAAMIGPGRVAIVPTGSDGQLWSA